MEKVEQHLTFIFPPWVHCTDQTNNYSNKITGNEHKAVLLAIQTPCDFQHV